MAKVKIEIKKPQYLTAKSDAKMAVKKAVAGTAGSLPGFFKLLLFLSICLFGYAIFMAARVFEPIQAFMNR